MHTRKSNDTTAMAGEFFTMQALYRLGHQPALTLGEAKSIDIIVRTLAGNLVEVSVKSVQGGGKWPVGKDDLSSRQNLVFVFLHFSDFSDLTCQPEVFVIPAPKVEKLKEGWFDQYAVYFSNPTRRERLIPFKDKWRDYFK